ncbi:MAG: sigma factor [Gemmatimonadales bacterium]
MAPYDSREAFEAGLLPELDTLYRLALRLTIDRNRAEDLVRETVLKAFRAWSRLRPGTNLRGWLCTILRNTFIDDYRWRGHDPIPLDVGAARPQAAFRAVQDADPEGT